MVNVSYSQLEELIKTSTAKVLKNGVGSFDITPIDGLLNEIMILHICIKFINIDSTPFYIVDIEDENLAANNASIVFNEENHNDYLEHKKIFI